MIARKKPTDEMFVGELGMRQWIASHLDRMEVVDHILLRREDGRDVTVTNYSFVYLRIRLEVLWRISKCKTQHQRRGGQG